MIHEIEHLLGLCGERHPSFIYLLCEWHNIKYMFDRLKIYLKWETISSIGIKKQ